VDQSNPESQYLFNLIYAGQIIPQKGVHTLVEALDFLLHDGPGKNIHLTLLGNGHPDYESYLRNLIVDRRLQSNIDFLPPIPREEMPGVLRKFDAMILPSIYEEPLARSIQEAMACGLVVLSTLTGGSREIIVDGENGLTFTPGDARSLASQLEKLMSKPDLQKRLAQAGRKTIVERFDIRRSVDEIETYLCNLSTSTSVQQDWVATS
jgi:glycogen(starch) synthase